jgi:hypothetical protein
MDDGRTGWFPEMRLRKGDRCILEARVAETNYSYRHMSSGLVKGSSTLHVANFKPKGTTYRM